MTLILNYLFQVLLIEWFRTNENSFILIANSKSDFFSQKFDWIVFLTWLESTKFVSFAVRPATPGVSNIY